MESSRYPALLDAWKALDRAASDIVVGGFAGAVLRSNFVYALGSFRRALAELTVEKSSRTERRCTYCNRPHPVSDRVFEESPMCAACLPDRVALRAAANAVSFLGEVAKRGPGRPVETGRGHDGQRVNVRFSAAEYAAVRAAAERDGAETVAQWVREVALAMARGAS